MLKFTLASAIVSCIILAIAITTNSPDDLKATHTGHLPNLQTTEAANLEHRLDIEKGGDAVSKAKVTIDREYVDTTISCEFCTRIEFNATEKGVVGLAYKNDNINLTGFNRMVFFARAENPQKVSFLAIGTKYGWGTGSTNTEHIFPNDNFALITKRVTLDSQWKRLEINLDRTEVKGVTLPFGFMTSDYEPYHKQVFYFKGITFDRKRAENPLPLMSSYR